MENVIVVGGGQAGASTVAKLRMLGFNGSLTLLCEENEYPYQRPPLSKKYLMGDFEKERLYLRPKSFYEEHNIKVLLNTKCNEIDTKLGRIDTGKKKLPFDKLVLSTGSEPKKLPSSMGGDLPRVFVVRNLKDIHSIQPHLKTGNRALVVGGGYIGLETASALVSKGLKVTILEASKRILQRIAAPETSDYFRQFHKKKGVTLIEDNGLETIDGDQRAEVAILTDGARIEVDLIIVGIGIIPSTKIAEQAGIEVENGIKVDSLGQTSNSNIWATGDCSSFIKGDQRIRLESVQNAIDQSEIVAENLLGGEVPYEPVPWFWSDQYDTKLQIAGLSNGYNKVITRSSSIPNAVSFWYMKNDHLLAVDSINDPRSYMVGKRMLEKGLTPDPKILADPLSDLKQLLT